MSKLICPFCKCKLKIFCKYKDGTSTVYCSKCNLIGDSKLFSELIRTRKALDVAVDALNTLLKEKNEHTQPDLYVLTRALKEITALEQKDIK